MTVQGHTSPADHAPIGQCDGLVAEANAQDGDARPKCPDGRDRDAGLLRPGGAWRDDNRLWPLAGNILNGQTSAICDLDISASEAEAACQVEGEAVAVIEKEDQANSSGVRTRSMMRSAFS